MRLAKGDGRVTVSGDSVARSCRPGRATSLVMSEISEDARGEKANAVHPRGCSGLKRLRGLEMLAVSIDVSKHRNSVKRLRRVTITMREAARQPFGFPFFASPDRFEIRAQIGNCKAWGPLNPVGALGGTLRTAAALSRRRAKCSTRNRGFGNSLRGDTRSRKQCLRDVVHDGGCHEDILQSKMP